MTTTVALPALLVSRADRDLIRKTIAGVILQGHTTPGAVQDGVLQAIAAAAPEQGWAPERTITLGALAQDQIVETFAAATARVIAQEAAGS
jgi:hypothetical protein